MPKLSIEKLIQNTIDAERDWLKLNKRGLDHAPEAVFRLANLRRLEMWGNELTDLPESLAQVEALEDLDLSDNRFVALPTPACCPNLKRLLLDRNRIKAVTPEIGGFGRLKHLSLVDNPIESIPDEISELTNLTTLNLASTRVSELPNSLGQLRNLTSLWVGATEMSSIPDCVLQLEALESLDMSDCDIRKIPDGIGALRNLQHLVLHSNDISSVPDSIFELDNLQTLILANNPRLDKIQVPDGALPNLISLETT